MKTIAKFFPIVLLCISAYAAQDPGWPRQKTLQGTTLVYYQPQIDDWKDYKQLDARNRRVNQPPTGHAVSLNEVRAMLRFNRQRGTRDPM